MAQAEGLAAGTGLLTGEVVRSAGSRAAAVVNPECPTCDGVSEIVVVDLVVHSTTLRCQACGRRWTVAT
ncbi:hypothetical protein [Aquihabitans sp. McL0605]|uniref:hypothetical protein n=1 Tax=Aquihabitans sp. McL0605 TaxID=3415671 RepID=UPI003CEFECD3